MGPSDLRACTLLKRDSNAGALLWILRNFYIYFEEHLWMPASGNLKAQSCKAENVFCFMYWVKPVKFFFENVFAKELANLAFAITSVKFVYAFKNPAKS